MNEKPKKLRHYIPLFFLVSTYIAWLAVQGINSALANFVSQISIAITMVFGSFVAGGTALGGGAVAFPVMTKALAIEPVTAKVFSLAIQSFGMTAASLTIIFGGIRYYRSVAVLALLGAIPGVCISLMMLAEFVPRLVTKSVFSLFLLIFAVTLLRTHWTEKTHFAMDMSCKKQTSQVIFAAFIGGIVSGMIGSGADIAVFALLMLYFKADLKIATATSVLVMAATSIVGTLVNAFYLNVITPQITNYVLAAIPIVIIGAPLGAFFCAKVPKKGLLSVLMLLIALEISFTMFEVMSR